MISHIPPAWIPILGALVVPFLKGRGRTAYVLLLPVLGLANLVHLSGQPAGDLLGVGFLDYHLQLLHVDRLSLVFGYAFHVAMFVTLLYGARDDRASGTVAGLVYAGSSLGVVFSGDWVSLFGYWELMALSSSVLIWGRRTPRAYAAGVRYFLVHAVSGLLILFGILLLARDTGDIAVAKLELDNAGTYLIFVGVGINCAWPGLHAWLTDAYPEATITGTVFLSAFTTKTAVYLLARVFPGADPLIWIGAAMAAFPIFYAVIENDLRRVLSYSLINQVGFMVVGVGIGTELAINGAVAHAVADIIFKGLLFMAMGAVLRQTGKIDATDLGGLYKTMPWTAAFCMVGAASISAFPLFSAFATKSMIVSAAGLEGMAGVWFILMFASAGVFHHAGIKIPFFAFFSHDSGLRPKEAPRNMLWAMGIAAGLCILIGVFPGPLYGLLPYDVTYHPYTAPHILGQLQLLFFSALAFTLLMLSGVYPPEIRAVNVDVDWLYRKAGVAAWRPLARLGAAFGAWWHDAVAGPSLDTLVAFSRNPMAATRLAWTAVQLRFATGEEARILRSRLHRRRRLFPEDSARPWPIGFAVTWIVAFLFVYLVLYYFKDARPG